MAESKQLIYIFEQNNMEEELDFVVNQSAKNKQAPQNTLSFSHSNFKNNQKILNKQTNSQKIFPFDIIQNFRLKNKKQEYTGKRGKKVSERNKRKMSQSQLSEQHPQIIRFRKMTESIEIDGILEENSQELGEKIIFRQFSENQDEIGFDYQNVQEIWENPELQKIIPMEIGQHILDLQSPLELSSQNNIYRNDQDSHN